MARAKRRWAFDAVSTGLMAGHGIVLLAALGFGLLIWIEFTPVRLNLGRWRDLYADGMAATPGLHLLLMWIMPVWSWLAARTQTQVSRLWAWLGYLIPIAGFWLPVQTLRRLAHGADPEAARLRILIVAWGVARGVSTLSAFIAMMYVIYKSGLTQRAAAIPAVIYLVVTISAAHLLSLLVISGMRRYLASTAIDTRHAEIFA